ncbi:hypothetical protein [Kibdelosporangium aridum]|uniref:hypothetical protein n=1 Tax=Kibdelosporangium aridum TaxID=2030 RepID=UPI000525BEF4
MRKTGIVAASVALALTVVGCASKETGIPLAAGGTSSAPTVEGETKNLGSASELANAINNKSDAKKSAKMTFTTGVAGQSFKGEGAFNADGDNSAMRMTMDIGSMKMEIILVDKVIYMKMPPGMGGAAAGTPDKPWTKITPGGDDPLSKQMTPMLENIDDSFDIGMQIDRIKSAGTINKTTKEQLDGEQVTHYAITIDTAKLAQNAPTPEAKESAKTLGSIGVKSFDMDWWINSDDLPVKITSLIPGPNNMKVTMEATYKDWGQPVDVKAPPADQIAN